MGINGMYVMYYTGAKDFGYTVLILKNGMIAGADSIIRSWEYGNAGLY